VLRSNLARSLMAAGFHVLTATDEASALACLERENPDLAVIDLALPGKGGAALCSLLREKPAGRDIPVLILMESVSPEALERAFESGATDFAPRGTAPAELRQRILFLQRPGTRLADLRVTEARLATVERTARLGCWEYDAARGGFTLSGQAALVLGLPGVQGSVSLEAIMAHVHTESRDEVAVAFERAIHEGESFSLDYRVAAADQTEKFLHAHALVAQGSEPGAFRLLGTFQDVTERMAAEKRIRYLAFFDSLTGLPNRIQFRLQLKTALDLAKRRSGLVGVLFLDLDHFKKINDSVGHEAGDLLLKVVAERLREAVRNTDTVARDAPPAPEGVVARLGGDEFILAVSDLVRPGDAARIALRVLDLLKQPFVIAGKEMSVSASIGISTYPGDGLGVDELLKNADRALYHAKDSGRNNFQFFSPAMNTTALERLSLELSLRQALDQGQFMLHYQPQVNPRDGGIVGAEALLRWNHPNLGVMPPAQFIPVSEEIGLIRGIGEWVMREGARQAREWRDQGLGAPRIAINVSAIQFKSVDFAAQLIEIVKANGLLPDQIELELTERLLVEPDSQAVESLRTLKERGFRLSLDDFGTGYSSLAYLKRFSIDCLKIDRSFVQGIEHNPNDRAIVSAILALASGLGIETVAEGVESAYQRDFLLEHDCDVMQGFLFGRPLSARDFEDLLKRSHPTARTPISRLEDSEDEAPAEVEEPVPV